MKTKFAFITAMIILASAILSACQVQPAAAGAAPIQAQVTQALPAVEPTAAQLPLPTQEPTAAQTPTQDPAQAQVEQAEQAARAYFAAVSEGNTEDAADLLSSFSLMVFQMTRGDAASALQAQKIEGARWSDLDVQETLPFDAQTKLVRVSYSETIKGPTAAVTAPTPPAPDAQKGTAEIKEALWPMRLENGAWLYNWDNLIDFRTLDARAQTMNGITIMPVQMNRYSDRIQLSMLVQNRTNETVVFGQANETLGTFHFGEKTVVAEKTQWILNPLRSVPAATLEVKGLYANYPDTIEIRKWNNYNVQPWYVFHLQ